MLKTLIYISYTFYWNSLAGAAGWGGDEGSES